METLKRCFRAVESRFRLPSSQTSRGPAFQFMSDLHLEIGQQYLTFNLDVTAPNLILPGDIGRLIDYEGYLAFLQKQTAHYERVLLVLENHEFYGLSFDDGLARALALEKEASLENKMVLLQQKTSSFDDGGVAVLGCPLWSLIPEDSAATVSRILNDFKKIEGWTIEKHKAAHSDDLVWLRQEAQHLRPHSKVLVATHHAPLIGRTASPQHKDSPIKSASAADILCNRKKSWSQVK